MASGLLLCCRRWSPPGAAASSPPAPIYPSSSIAPRFHSRPAASGDERRRPLAGETRPAPLVLGPPSSSPRGPAACRAKNASEDETEAGDGARRKALQAALWAAEAAYVLWLFVLPYAPGDPAWAIKPNTVNDLLGLSLNFFFVLPVLNAVGIHVIESPVLHPMAEGLFNFVIGWTLLFAPLLFTDCQRDRYKGSLDLLWGLQMFLTNTFLIPYMAIRLGDVDVNRPSPRLSRLGLLMVSGASVVGVLGGFVCFVSIVWALVGRSEGNFGGVMDRWMFLESYVGSERLAYAFLWDIFFYSVFQPWLIADNLQNVKTRDVEFINVVRYIPVVGLVAYLLSLTDGNDS